jgi:hypothetical protein
MYNDGQPHKRISFLQIHDDILFQKLYNVEINL